MSLGYLSINVNHLLYTTPKLVRKYPVKTLDHHPRVSLVDFAVALVLVDVCQP